MLPMLPIFQRAMQFIAKLSQDILIGKVTIMSRSDILKGLPPGEVSGIFEL
jgi:hypothetical protein